MNFVDQLEKHFPSRVKAPVKLADISSGKYVVYILTVDNQPIVVGHGKKNRARVIFDDKNEITKGHFKAMLVRLYVLFGSNKVVFCRYIIECKDKAEANQVEVDIHRKFGGNTTTVPKEIMTALFIGLAKNSPVRLILQIALNSAFDGISDLHRWRKKGILGDKIWKQIAKRLQLD